ncbi:MAG TPA: 50S ribosomal protein L3 [Candidatus Limnocylindrales bacterium]|nr:50S ribosomal protein L3 [Candidatus Limnocylindrales bacterium]
MISTLIGQKLNQAQDFYQNGKRVPVTEIVVSENVVLQVKTTDKDSYSAIQLGYGNKKKPIKALLGHSKKAGVKHAPLKAREVSVKDVAEDEMPKTGDLIKVDAVFKPGDIVQVSGISKGKGFAGGVKRHGFKGGPKTHGQSDRHRAPGSIGQGTTPGRVYKGKRMAGRMGSDTVTLKNLTVVDVDADNNRLYISGLVPGHRNSLVYVTKTGERKNFVQLLSSFEKEEAESNAAEAKAAEEAAKVVEEAPVVETPAEEAKVDEAVAEEAPTNEEKTEAAAGSADEKVVEEEKPAEVIEDAPIEKEEKKDA